MYSAIILAAGLCIFGKIEHKREPQFQIVTTNIRLYVNI